MNKILRLSLIALLAVFCGGGVFAEVYKTLTFPDDNKDNNKAGSYTATWTAKMGTDSWSISNFNNNSWNNDWAYIKAGRKKTASVASIKTDFAIDMPVNYVAITIDKVTASNINSIKLNVCNDEACTDIAETVTAGTIATGELKLEVATPKANCYYQIVIDCAAGSSNGFFQISKVVYDATISGPVKQNAGLKFSENNISYKKGETFTAPTFTKATTADVTFVSDNEAVATVNANGEILLAGGVGTAVITATSAENEEYRAGEATCKITVIADEVTLPYEETFADGIGSFTIDDVSLGEGLSYVWKHDASNKYMKASAYNKKNIASESWLVSPTIDLTNISTATLSFSQCINKFFGNVGEEATLWIQEVGGAWKQITIEYPTIEAESNWSSWMNNTDISLNEYAGKKIKIGFKYTSTDTAAGTWEIKNVAVKGVATGINNITNNTINENAPIYNLAGQRVNKTAKGILIQNGKKFVNK